LDRTLLLTILAFSSGMCGIAYEVLYSRLLTTYLGDMFHVNAAILASFLLGIAIGSLTAHRWVKHLWAIEIAIGVYAAVVAAVFARLSFPLLHSVLPMTSRHSLLAVLFLAAVLAVPSILVGFSIPLFAQYQRAQLPSAEHTFHDVYGIYNLGAAVCVLLIEFALLRSVGVRGSLVVLAGVNILNGLALRAAINRLEPAPEEIGPPKDPVPRRVWIALFLVSIASGTYQLFALKIAGAVFGPFHENFAIVLALGLFGLTTGARLVARRSIGFVPLLVGGGAAIALTFAFTEPAIWLWAHLNASLGFTPSMVTAVKGTVLTLMNVVPLTVLGATVPAIVARRSDERTGGLALGVSSLGNCAGYLLTVFFLYEHLSLLALAVVIPLVLILTGLVLSAAELKPLKLRPVWFAALLAVPLVAFAWPAQLLHVGFVNLISPSALTAVKKAVSLETVRKFDSEVSMVKSPTGQEFMILNGYGSVAMAIGGKTNTRELIVGLAPSLYSKGHDRALVLGIGTGITAGSTSRLYRHTVGVELNPAIFEVLPRFSTHNFALQQNPEVSLVLDDGISALAASSETYDAIINTVTSPLYFASSKLYTKDFFDLAASRLSPGGVYAFWFDGRVTEAGAAIIFRTVAQSFTACHLVYLDSGYAQVICSNEPLAIHPRVWPPELEEKFASLNVGLERLTRALIFPVHKMLEPQPGAPINTFDLPALEFVMSADALSLDQSKSEFSPFELLGADVHRSAFEAAPLTDAQLADRCFVLRAWAEQPVNFCTRRLDQPNGRLPDSFLLPALALTPEGGLLSNERLKLLAQLRENGHPAEVLAGLEAMDPRVKSRPAYVVLRAQALFDRDGDLSEPELSRLFISNPLGVEVRRLLARVAHKRGQTQVALQHLDAIERFGASTPEDRAFAAQWKAEP
jgi:spermidine synthase